MKALLRSRLTWLSALIVCGLFAAVVLAVVLLLPAVSSVAA